MHQRLRSADIGPLLNHSRRHAERQIGRQLQIRELNIGNLILGGKTSCQNGERVAGLLQLLLQRRQRGLRRGQLRLLCQHIASCNRAELKLLVQQIQFLTLGCDNVLGRRNLCRQGGGLNRRRDHVGRQREISGLKLKTAVLFHSGLGFDRPADTAEHVRSVGHRRTCAKQIERAPNRSSVRARLLPRDRGAGIELRKNLSLLREIILMRLPQIGLSSLNIRVGPECFLFQTVQCG